MRNVKIRGKLFTRDNSKLAKASVSSDRAEKNHSFIGDRITGFTGNSLRTLHGYRKRITFLIHLWFSDTPIK